MGKLKQLFMDMEDDMHEIARDMAGDMYEMIQDKKFDMFEELWDYIEEEDRDNFIAYIGGNDDDDLKTFIHNIIEDRLSDEGLCL